LEVGEASPRRSHALGGESSPFTVGWDSLNCLLLGS
jgi:hypothetical protein